MIGRIISPSRLIRFFRRKQAINAYNLADMQKAELAKFEAAGLDASAARPRLNECLTSMSSKPFDHVSGTDSIHWLLFASLSLSEWGESVQDILEIGTFRGKTTQLLGLLFPSASIVTCDLPDEDPILSKSYRRETNEALAEYKATRDDRVQRPGVTFVARNSFFLPQYAPGPYDLIWVDGGHCYPEISWDICNAWHMCRPGGIIMIDDVFVHPDGGDKIYGSDESYQIINYIAERTTLQYELFLKRENPEWSADPRQRKFVALLRKPLAE